MTRSAVYVVQNQPIGKPRKSTYQDFNNGFSEMQYSIPASKIPWKALLLAGVLFVIGLILILSSLLMFSGIVETSHRDRILPILVLGVIMFIPGAYHVRIAYHAFKGDRGFSFDDIPDFD
ncbi:unnamed protein product [Anisakis simplex]|uniref:Transmembrane protein 230 n=1 Tax=Anisakis simplex TaxID=6269 RepID=A0A0M3JTN8_ANISI|nr:unnamed protein product [Anisakis simplex]